MNIVVFGADGFLGRHLVKGLAAKDGSFIRAFDRFSSRKTGLPHDYDAYDNIEIFQGNFSNREDVAMALRGMDFVFHLITTTTPASSINDPLVDIDTNIRSSVELFELCAEMDVKKVIFFSSGGTVYGDVDSDKISETVVLKPVSPYAIGKVTIENYLRYFKSTHGVDYIIYRIANPYGPGQNIYGKQGVIPIFMHHFLENEPITIFGNGEMVRDYIYIDDLVAMIIGSFNKNAPHDTYNIGSGLGRSVNELVDVIESISSIEPTKINQPTPATYVDKSVLCNDLFIKDFGIEPRIDLKEGIKRTWNHVKKLDN